MKLMSLKGIVLVFSVDPPLKKVYARFTRIPFTSLSNQ